MHFYRTPRTGNFAERRNGVYLPVVIYKRKDVELVDASGVMIGGGG